jgi:hypothetical protein
MSVTFSVTLDPNLLFTFGSSRLADNEPLVFTAQTGVEVTIQIAAPMKFTASHDERGKQTAWKLVPTTDGSCVMAWSFSCPRSPFTLTVATTGTSGTTTGTSKTKKVRIEAGASGSARGHGVQAPGHQDE